MDKSSTVPNGAGPGAGAAEMQAAAKVANRPQLQPPDSTDVLLDGQKTSQESSANTSVTHSPLASRESSPTRNPRRTTSTSRLSGSRSRTSSQQDLSPSRQMRSSLSGRTPSSRSLSSTTYPTLHPAPQDTPIQAPAPQKPAVSDLKDSPRWPVSPRLRSPPPQTSKAGIPTLRRNEQEPPAIAVQRPTPSPGPSESQTNTSGSDTEDSQLQSGLRTPARGALETVQEVSLPNSPSPTSEAHLLAQVKEKLENQSDSAVNDQRTLRARSGIPTNDSGSEASSTKRDRRPTSVPPPPLVSAQSSGMTSKQLKPKQDVSTQEMTVETETVTSIPQVALATGTKSEGGPGTLKTKPSTETIKPKKEKRKTSRKQPSVNAGNGKMTLLLLLHTMHTRLLSQGTKLCFVVYDVYVPTFHVGDSMRS